MKKILSRSGWLAVAAALTMGFTACSGIPIGRLDGAMRPYSPYLC